MRRTRTSQISVGWLYAVPLLDVVFLLFFFFLLSSDFMLQPGISVSVPFSRFTLGPQPNPAIISITGGTNPATYLRDQKDSTAQPGPDADRTKQAARSTLVQANS